MPIRAKGALSGGGVAVAVLLAAVLSCGGPSQRVLPVDVVGDRAYWGVKLTLVVAGKVSKTFTAASFDEGHAFRADLPLPSTVQGDFVVEAEAELDGCLAGIGAASATVGARSSMPPAVELMILETGDCGEAPDGGAGTGGHSSGGSGGAIATGGGGAGGSGGTGMGTADAGMDDGGTGGAGGGPGTDDGGVGSGGASGTGGAGAGSASGTGGAGTGGAGTGGAQGCSDPYLIDDFEAGTGYVCGGNGRSGYWFSYRDTSSTLSPAGVPTPPSTIPQPRGSSNRALHLSGTFVQYAGAGCFLRQTPATYNASAYSGLRFFAKGSATAPKLIVQTSATESTTYGGQCSLPTLSCAANEAPIIGMVTDAWTRFEIPFVSLMNGVAPFNSADVWSIEFQPGAGVYDFWIDDLSFF